MDLENAYGTAMLEINELTDAIIEEFQEKSGGMMSREAAREMAEKQWLYGNLYALKSRKKLTQRKVKNGNTDKSALDSII